MRTISSVSWLRGVGSSCRPERAHVAHLDRFPPVAPPRGSCSPNARPGAEPVSRRQCPGQALRGGAWKRRRSSGNGRGRIVVHLPGRVRGDDPRARFGGGGESDEGREAGGGRGWG